MKNEPNSDMTMKNEKQMWIKRNKCHKKPKYFLKKYYTVCKFIYKVYHFKTTRRKPNQNASSKIPNVWNEVKWVNE